MDQDDDDYDFDDGDGSVSDPTSEDGSVGTFWPSMGSPYSNEHQLDSSDDLGGGVSDASVVMVDEPPQSPSEPVSSDDFSSDDSDSFSTPGPGSNNMGWQDSLSSMMGFFSVTIPWRDMEDYESTSESQNGVDSDLD